MTSKPKENPFLSLCDRLINLPVDTFTAEEVRLLCLNFAKLLTKQRKANGGKFLGLEAEAYMAGGKNLYETAFILGKHPDWVEKALKTSATSGAGSLDKRAFNRLPKDTFEFVANVTNSENLIDNFKQILSATRQLAISSGGIMNPAYLKRIPPIYNVLAAFEQAYELTKNNNKINK